MKGSAETTKHLLVSMTEFVGSCTNAMWVDTALDKQRNRKTLLTTPGTIAIRINKAHGTIIVVFVSMDYTDRSRAKTATMRKWQKKWSQPRTAKTARSWTKCLTPDLQIWFDNSNSHPTYHTVRVLMRLGQPQIYVVSIRRTQPVLCVFCAAGETHKVHPNAKTFGKITESIARYILDYS